MVEIQPTEEGKKRYPDEPKGYYVADFDDLRPCTCKPDCSTACKGGCGCDACSCSYGDFLSLE